MIDQANQLGSETGADNVEFRVADIYDLPFEDGEFDIVFSSAVTRAPFRPGPCAQGDTPGD